jgi:hypothetical protein
MANKGEVYLHPLALMDYIVEDAISKAVTHSLTQKLFIPKQRGIQCLQHIIYSFQETACTTEGIFLLGKLVINPLNLF